MPDIQEIIALRERIVELLCEVHDPLFLRFFDSDSDELLLEKISVLEDLKNGKTIEEIPMFYDVLELYPKENGTHWDL